MVPSGTSCVIGCSAVPLPQLLFGAAHAPLFLPADFIALRRLWGFFPMEVLFQVICQETPGQKTVQSLRAAGLDLHGKPCWPMHEAHTG